MSSRKTVVRAREGDRDAMERLYREYYNDVYRYCVYRCGDLHVGEDLAQETFLRLLKYGDGLEQLKKPKAYIIKVACNVCSSAAASAPPPLEPLPEGLAAQSTYGSDSRERVRHAVSQLGDDQRQVIIMFYFNDLRIADIARILDLPQSTVKSRLRRAREQLKLLLIKEGFH